MIISTDTGNKQEGKGCLPTYLCKLKTPLGEMTASASAGALTGLWFNDQRHFPAETGLRLENPGYPVFDLLRDWLTRYFAGDNNTHGLKLAPRGTAYQITVWEILLKIPHGRVTTYGQVACAAASARGQKTACAQAAGGAIGRNPISILVPCHRVIGSDGSLTGYGGGLKKKRSLLEIEGIDMSHTTPYVLTL